MRNFSMCVLICCCTALLLFSQAGNCSESCEKKSDILLSQGVSLLENGKLEQALIIFNKALKINAANYKIYPYRWQVQLAVIQADINKAEFKGDKKLVAEYEERWENQRNLISMEVISILNSNKWTEELLSAMMQGFSFGLPLNRADVTWKNLQIQVESAMMQDYPDSEYTEKLIREKIYDTLGIPRIYIPENADSIWPKEKLQAAIQEQRKFQVARLIILKNIIESSPRNNGRNEAWAYLLSLYISPTAFGGHNYFRDTGKFDEFCQKWLTSEPDNHAAYFYVANMCLANNYNADKVEEYAEKALQLLEREKPHTQYKRDVLEKMQIAYSALYGRVLMQKGRYKEALSHIKKAYDYNNLNYGLLYTIGQIYEKEGDIENAKKHYVLCLESGYHKEAELALEKICGEKSIREFRIKYAKSKNLPVFTDVTMDANICIGKKEDNVSRKERRVAIGDYDNDGWDDILLNGNVLYRNNGDGTFSDVTLAAGICRMEKDGSGGIIKHIISTDGGVWGDYDNDGNLDFFAISGYGPRDYLFHNNGDGTFTDVSESAGKVYDDLPTEGAAWCDINGDGFLDLYLANYEYLGKHAQGAPDKVFINQRNGTFKSADLEKIGVMPEGYFSYCGRGVSPADFDNDGDTDIFVSNYRLNPDFLWRNDGKGLFTDVSRKLGVKGIPSATEGTVYYGHTIGSQWADFNNDGYLDLISCNLAHPRYISFSNKTMLFINSGPKKKWKFYDIRQRSGITYDELHADPGVADINNDGYLDLYITSTYIGSKSYLYINNGKFVMPEPRMPYDNNLPEKKYDNSPMFEDVSWVTGTRVDNAWGCAWFDFDNDGDQDLLVGCENGVRLFRNDQNNNFEWVKVRLVGTCANRSAIGARIYVYGKNLQNGRPFIYTRHVEGGKGTTNQSSFTQHFGLGESVVKKRMNLLICWPGGQKQIIKNIAVRKYHTIYEPGMRKNNKKKYNVSKRSKK